MSNGNDGLTPGQAGTALVIVVVIMLLLSYWKFAECRKVGHGLPYCILLNK